MQAGGAVEAVGDAVREQRVRETALRASRALADAAEASVIDLTRELREAGEQFRNRPRSGATAAAVWVASQVRSAR